MRKFTRLKNGFSKKVENQGCAIAIHFVYDNFVKQRQKFTHYSGNGRGFSESI